jgi:bifunctional DNA-binding transcriptional regulator/antitoxin component of YhaV-PrlF toxin-antitoxin module
MSIHENKSVMVSTFTAKVGKSGNSLYINIPKPLCDGYNLKKGDQVTIYDYGEKMVIPLNAILHEAKNIRLTLKKAGPQFEKASSDA